MNKRKKFNSILFRAAFAMLVLVLFTTHFSAGIAAKFLSTATGSDSAHVAKFHGGTVELGSLDPIATDIKLKADSETKWFVFKANVKLVFESCEVARKFSFELYFDRKTQDDYQYNSSVYQDEKATLICPSSDVSYFKRLSVTSIGNEDTYQFLPIDSNFTETMKGYVNPVDEVKFEGGSNSSPTQGYVYYAINDTWVKEVATTTSTTPYRTILPIIQKTEDMFVGGEGAQNSMNEVIYKFSFLFFMCGYGDKDAEINFDKYVKYNLECWQVD